MTRELYTIPLEEYIKNTQCGLFKPSLAKDQTNPLYRKLREGWEVQTDMIWVYREVPMADDKVDFFNLHPKSQSVLKSVMLFFAQSDKEVSRCYTDLYLHAFQLLELRTMLVAFAYVETNHIWAYEYLVKSIMSEDEVGDLSHEFLKYNEMKDKADFLHQFSANNLEDLAKTLVCFGAFAEGMFLFGSFAIFLYFSEELKILNGTSRIIRWSQRDEDCHVHHLSIVFKILVEENPGLISEEFSQEIYQCAKKMVELEEAFIDLIFKAGDLEGMKAADLKKYIRFLANYRLIQFGFQPIFEEKKNPLPWMGAQVGAQELTNFFESKVVDYSKEQLQGDFPWEIPEAVEA